MGMFGVFAVLITLTAFFSYLNYRTLKLPVNIGVMMLALAVSLILIVLDTFGLPLGNHARPFLDKIDFNQTLLQGLLSFLLFAGAVKIDLNDLLEQKWTIAWMAVAGTLLCLCMVATLTWLVFRGFGVPLPLMYCLLFGALIAPTDPVAVLSILRTAGVPKSLETKIAGESLFNDGIGIVAFIVLFEAATSGQGVVMSRLGMVFLQEALGGVLFGLVIGYLAYRMLKSLDHYQIELMITLALVAGGYALADYLHFSGPLAVVVAGLLIGNQGRLLAMSEKTRLHLDIFWELVEDVLNAILFLLIGLEVLLLPFKMQMVLIGLLIIPAVLLSRFLSIGTLVTVLKRFRRFSPAAIRIMTWSGLRGGLSVALALSLPSGSGRDMVLFITYAVVVFSILVQGSTIGLLVKRLKPGLSILDK